MPTTTMKYSMCMLLLLFLFCCVMLKRHHHWISIRIHKLTPLAMPSLFVWPNVTQENFVCSSNKSTVIPLHLPQYYQDFLRYRHCRAFPTLLSPSPCEDDLHLVLAIKSTAANVGRRAALRDTWGRAGRIQGRGVKLVFLMGHSPDRPQKHDLQPVLEWESRSHGDILQWDFVDMFYNLTRKEVQFLSWFSHTCSSAEFVFKGDDDMFVNTENLIAFLGNHKPENHLFTGYIHSPELPIRDQDSKYFVPVELYPEGKLYPHFPSGGGYLMSRQTVLGLHAVAQKLELFPLDDVFSGICLKQMGVDPVHHRGFLTFGLNSTQKPFELCVYQQAMVVHKMSPIELRVFWTLLQDRQHCNLLQDVIFF